MPMEKYIGVNIGTRTIKSVLIERDRQRWTVTKVRFVDHEYYGKDSLNPGNLKTRLMSALDGLEADKHPVIYSIDSRDIASAAFSLPAMPKEELDDAVLEVRVRQDGAQLLVGVVLVSLEGRELERLAAAVLDREDAAVPHIETRARVELDRPGLGRRLGRERRPRAQSETRAREPRATHERPDRRRAHGRWDNRSAPGESPRRAAFSERELRQSEVGIFPLRE